MKMTYLAATSVLALVAFTAFADDVDKQPPDNGAPSAAAPGTNGDPVASVPATSDSGKK